jgi:hypothetical protein
MKMVLSPYGSETARYTVPYSLQHTETYNRASKEPERLQNFQPCGHGKFQENNIPVVNFINTPTLYIIMNTDKIDGEYLDSNKWDLVVITKKTDSRGRIYVSESNCGKEIRVFVSDEDIDPGKCKNFILLPYAFFTEVRKSRIKKNAGEPLKVQASGSVWMGAENKDKYVKVFVRK